VASGSILKTALAQTDEAQLDPNVIASFGEAAPGRTLLFEGHPDVVTEGDPAEWRHPPFGGELADGRIWGRGAADMKGGLAAAMVAAAASKRSGAPIRGRLVVGALADEEGDMLGGRHFVATPIGRQIDAAIICEPEQKRDLPGAARHSHRHAGPGQPADPAPGRRVR
jgi:succinyl-diaminopimelate desuccinylase